MSCLTLDTPGAGSRRRPVIFGSAPPSSQARTSVRRCPERVRTAAKRAAPAQAVKPAAAAKQKPAAASGRAAKRKPARGRTAAAPGQREQDVLRLVRERPGITVAELAGELSVDATGLYGIVRRLQSKGQISKDGTRLQPVAEPTPSTDRSTTPPAQSSPVTPAASTESGPDSPQTPATES